MAVERCFSSGIIIRFHIFVHPDIAMFTNPNTYIGLAAAIVSVNIFLFSYCISGSRCLDGYTIVSLIC